MGLLELIWTLNILCLILLLLPVLLDRGMGWARIYLAAAVAFGIPFYFGTSSIYASKDLLGDYILSIVQLFILGSMAWSERQDILRELRALFGPLRKPNDKSNNTED